MTAKTAIKNSAAGEAGFTLIELLVVVFVLGVILTIAVPNLKRARQHANAGSALHSLRTITTAQYQYENSARVYATLGTLASLKLVDSQLGSGSKSNYSFTIELAPNKKSFACKATPVGSANDSVHFFVDQTGVIRSNVGAPADANSQPIP